MTDPVESKKNECGKGANITACITDEVTDDMTNDVAESVANTSTKIDRCPARSTVTPLEVKSRYAITQAKKIKRQKQDSDLLTVVTSDSNTYRSPEETPNAIVVASIATEQRPAKVPKVERTPELARNTIESRSHKKKVCYDLESIDSSNPDDTGELNRWEKEIAAFNTSPKKLEFEETKLLKEIQNDFGIRATRRTMKKLTDIVKNRESSPEKNLNIASMSRLEGMGNTEQLAAVDGSSNDSKISLFQEKDWLENDEVDHEPLLDEDSGIKDCDLDGMTDSESGSGESGDYGRREKSVERTLSSADGVSYSSSKETEATCAPTPFPCRTWDEWHSQKNQLLAILRAPPPSTGRGGNASFAQQPLYHPLMDVPPEYKWGMENKVHVFRPSYNDFMDFPRFLEHAERIAGRKAGLVKVILPSFPTPKEDPDLSMVDSPLLVRQEIHLIDKETPSGNTKVYGVKIVDQEMIRASDIEIEERDTRDLETQLYRGYEVAEQDMVANSRLGSEISRSSLATVQIKGKANDQALRRSLKLRDLRLSAINGNLLTQPTISEVCKLQSLQISLRYGATAPIALNCKNLATYSMSYLHKGAPRWWTVIEPSSHAKLEETMHMVTADTLRKINNKWRADEPPQCDQVITHQRLYLPKQTLEALELPFHFVLQQENEIIITFPFAYRQAFNVGSNIVEEISYANEIWEDLHRKELYKQCTLACPGEQLRLNPSVFLTSRMLRYVGGATKGSFPPEVKTDRRPTNSERTRKRQTRSQDVAALDREGSRRGTTKRRRSDSPVSNPVKVCKIVAPNRITEPRLMREID